VGIWVTEQIQGSLHCATDGETVRRFGRDDVSLVGWEDKRLAQDAEGVGGLFVGVWDVHAAPLGEKDMRGGTQEFTGASFILGAVPPISEIVEGYLTLGIRCHARKLCVEL
jgi:hypothetical protein